MPNEDHVTAMALVAPAPAGAAYLDPATGSLVVQVVIATVVGLGVSVRLYWAKLKSLLGLKSDANPASTSVASDGEPAADASDNE